ncbi:MAG: dCTP deaminase [Actinobacteria bacterium]|nr:dCTP deaminase [Actinomycetota bacterium]
MAQTLRSYQAKIDQLVELLLETSDPSAPESWPPAIRRSLANLTRTGFDKLATTQLELFPYLPLGPRPSADLMFFLARVVDMSPTRPAHQRRFTVSYSPFSDWNSRVFESSAQSVVALPIPFAETFTPLRWPLLVHEFGHWLGPGGEPLKSKIDDALQERYGDAVSAEKEHAFDEILADLIAYRACGLAYLYALAAEGHLALRGGHADRPPRILIRLQQLGDEGNAVAAGLPDEWDYEVEVTDEQRDFAVSLAELAAGLVEGFSPQSPRNNVVARARRLLGAHEPASSVQVIEPVRANLEMLRAHAALRERFFQAAIDTPCTDAEILRAAWEEELADPATQLGWLELPGLGDEDGEAGIENAVAKLASRDIALSRSLQAAAVHRWLLQWDDDIRERAQIRSVDVAIPSTSDDPEETSPLTDYHLVRRLTHAGRDRRLVIRPLMDYGQVGGTTVDLRLGTEWEVLRTSRFESLNPGADPNTIRSLLDASVEEFRLTTGQKQDVILHPGELLLALTLEYLHLPNDLWGNLEGRSTWARLGLQVHATAGMIDAGFKGYITLELQNTGRLPLVLSPGLRVAQIAFFPVRDVVLPYEDKPTAAYSAQTKARTAFPRQHEHRALHKFLEAEEQAENEGYVE